MTPERLLSIAITVFLFILIAWLILKLIGQL